MRWSRFYLYTTREVPSNDRSRSGLSDYRTSKTSAGSPGAVYSA